MKETAEQTVVALNMSERFRLPPGMDEAILAVELGIMPDDMARLPQRLIDHMLLYSGIKRRNQ